MLRRDPQCLSLLLSLLLACAPPPEDSNHRPLVLKAGLEQGRPAVNSFTATGPAWVAARRMAQARFTSTSTLLLSGKVLVVGGSNGSHSRSSAEVYDPSEDSWSSAGAMNENRSDHSATLLSNGKVLVAGGFNARGYPLASAELYDPTTNSWSPAGNMNIPRTFQTATLLRDGKVLVVGGATGFNKTPLNSVEKYDPASNTWSPGLPLQEARTSHTATLLPDGKVLVLGAYAFPSTSTAASSLEIYDPETGTWLFRVMPCPIFWHTSTLLPDGRVLVAGGFNPAGHSASGSSSLASLYTPATNTWSTASPMIEARDRHTATLLPNGSVLITGGSESTSWAEIGRVLNSTEVYEPRYNQWSSTGGLVEKGRALHMATLLPTGRLLVMGGVNNPSYYSESGYVNSSAELYSGDTYTASLVSYPLDRCLSNQTASLLQDGRLLIVGDNACGSGGRISDIYDFQTKTWTQTGPMLQRHSAHTATVLPNGQILVIGGGEYPYNDVAELYDPVSKRWLCMGRMEPSRKNHTATLLPNGKVLVLGGNINNDGHSAVTASATLFDPATQQWSSAGSMRLPRARHSVTLLPNGKVLVIGGDENEVLPIAELYDPAENSWGTGGTMIAARIGQTATLLRNGKVLVIGGRDRSNSFFRFMEEYDPTTNRWSLVDSSTLPRSRHSAISLSNGNVLVTGGTSDRMGTSASSELYDPITKRWSDVNLSHSSGTTPELVFPLVPLPGGQVIVFGDKYMSVLTSRFELESLRPVVTLGGSTAPELGEIITLTGSGFRGPADSNPLISLFSLETGQWIPLLGQSFSETSGSAKLPYVPVGQYLLNVTTHGLTSSRVLFIKDTTPPAITLDPRVPKALTQDITATFAFRSNAVDLAGFECSLDKRPFTRCVSPMEYLSLRDGEHSFELRGLDLAGNVTTPIEHQWAIDTTPPDLSLKAVSPWSRYSAKTTASFSFISNARDVAFAECSLDEAQFTRCDSPQSYSKLPDGEHSFRLRAIDKAGNVTPVLEHGWAVDTQVPVLVLVSKPPRFTNTSDAKFLFVEEPGVKYKCSLDSAGFVPCSDGHVYASLKDGKYSFRLQATDLAENSSISQRYEWTVDTSPPTVEFTSQPPETTRNNESFSFSSKEHVDFTCALDDVVFPSCSSPWTPPPLLDGVHTFRVQAKDLAGNTQINAQEYSWTVDTLSPEVPELREEVLPRRVFASQLAVSGTAEAGSTLHLFVDGVLSATTLAGEFGDWEVLLSSLDWGPHVLTVTATDLAGNTSPPSPEHRFTLEQRGYYGMGCESSPGSLPVWSLGLLGIVLSRRKREPVTRNARRA